MGVKLSVAFEESNGAMTVVINVKGNGRETPEELNRAMAMAKAVSAVVKETHNGQSFGELTNDARVQEVMARGYQHYSNDIH
ncbi:hypothetical protein FVI95_00030 [Salmonella enterica subsp. enterica serovar Hvittingfoss]|nr:hypothetical protein [Salmonella enterica subsp. enterica serovar Abony]ECV7438869.1 hypothetical protein [Salmonella enterica subsp. enterica serovar Newport]EDA5930015.1 hypothetical protein [Salmonella enterica subsp. enterica serovar Kottbus]EEB1923346.1 hypothetical protein [Salmonella enterica subsp. enterica serovar Hvittingfoss]